MKHNEAMERIEEIQRIAERYTLFTLLPGIPAIIGGILVLAGCIVSYSMIRSLDFGQLAGFSASIQGAFLIMWIVIGVTAIVQEVLLTSREGKKQGIAIPGRPGKLAIYSLTPSIFVATVITIRILLDMGSETAVQNIRYIAPVWMMCYGMGIYAAGLFSLRLPRFLGIAFLLTGTAGMIFFEKYGLLLVALSFGILHILFGLFIIMNGKRSN
jgi:hypothetical protein